MVGSATCATSSPARPGCSTRPAGTSPGSATARRPVNVEGTRNVLDAARRNQVPKVVNTSTLAVNSDTEEQAVDATYRVTGEHRSAYDRTTTGRRTVCRETSMGQIRRVLTRRPLPELSLPHRPSRSH